MAKNDLSRFLAQSRPTIQSWITTATAASVTRIVTQNYITQTVDLTGYLTTTNGDIRYYPRTVLDPTLNSLIALSHAQEHDIAGGDHTALGADLGMVLMVGGVVEMEDGTTLEMEDDTDLDLELDTLGWTYLSHDQLIGVNADDHHDPVTTADATHIAVTNQVLSAGSDMALRDIDNTFSTSQNITGGLTASTFVTATTGNITATAGNITASQGNVAATIGNVTAGGLISAGSTIASGSTITSGADIVATTDITAQDDLIVWDSVAIGGGSDTAITAYNFHVEGSSMLAGLGYIGAGSTHATGSWWYFSDAGEMRSLDPVWSIEGDGSEDGTIVAQDMIGTQFLDMRHGTMAVQVLEVESVKVTGGEEWWIPGSAAPLIADTATPSTDLVIELEMEDGTTLELEDGEPLEIEATFGAISLPIKNPTFGQELQYDIGEHIIMKGFVNFTLTDVVGTALFDPASQLSLGMAFPRSGYNTATVYATIIDYEETVTADGTYFTYTAILDARYDGRAGTFPQGTAVAGFGRATADKREGIMRISPGAYANYGPYLWASTIGDADTGDWWDERKVAWLGNLQGAPNGQTDEFGFMAGINLGDSAESYIVASNKRLEMYGPDATWSDSDGTYLVIDSDGIKLDSLDASSDFVDLEAHTGNRKITFYDDLTTADNAIAGISAFTRITQGLDADTLQISAGRVDASIYYTELRMRANGLYDGSVTVYGGRADSGVGLSGQSIFATASNYVALTAPTITLSSPGITELILERLPTSATGLTVGAVWNDSGTLKIKV